MDKRGVFFVGPNSLEIVSADVANLASDAKQLRADHLPNMSRYRVLAPPEIVVKGTCRPPDHRWLNVLCELCCFTGDLLSAAQEVGRTE